MKLSFTPQSSAGVFSVTQWNTLADCLSDSFPLCPSEFLSWEHRSRLHVEHLLQRAYGDIICLEEVDHPETFVAALSATHEVLFHKKPDGQDGQLVAVSRKKFSVVKSTPIQYVIESSSKPSNQSFFDVVLEDNSTKQVVRLFVTHLKAKKEFEDIRVEQVSHLIMHIHETKQPSHSLLIVGDFNAEPEGKCIKHIRTNLSNLQSAYDYTKSDFFSTFKVRADKQNNPIDIQKRTIDYIFYTADSLRLLLINELPSADSIGVNGLPNKDFSSDHLSLTATFSFIYD